MQENTNRAIVINTIILYTRLGITLVAGLFTTRFALQALGDVDFGLVALVGSIISFIAIINTTMLGASNRFIAAAIGSGDEVFINKTFNVNLIIQLGIALFTLIVALPIGYWYIINYVNYSGSIDNAVAVYFISITASVISFIGVAYNGLMLARERFLVFCLVETFFSVFKLAMTYLILFYFENKLIVYSAVLGISVAVPTVIYYFYCRKEFPKAVKFRLIREKKLYREIFSFSAYVGFGTVVQVGQAQGAAIIINAFFNTVMNTAFGIANYFKSIILLCIENLTKSISPQITKSYAAGNYERCLTLMTVISRVSFLIAFIISVPFLTETEYLIGLWLGEVPPYSVIFSRLIVIDILINSLRNGMTEYVFATGNIKWYQILVNILLLFSIIAGYFILKAGYPAVSLLYVYIVFAILSVLLRLVILNKIYRIDIGLFLRESYLQCALVVLFSLPVMILGLPLHPILNIVLECLFVLAVSYLFGVRKSEKERIASIIRNRLLKNK